MQQISKKSLQLILASLAALVLGVWIYSAITVQNTSENIFDSIRVTKIEVVSEPQPGALYRLGYQMELSISNTSSNKAIISVNEKDCYLLIEQSQQIIPIKILSNPEIIVTTSSNKTVKLSFFFGGQEMLDLSGYNSVTGILIGKIKISNSVLWVSKTVEREFRTGSKIVFPPSAQL